MSSPESWSLQSPETHFIPFFYGSNGLYYDEYGFLKGQNASCANNEDDALLTKAKSFDMYSRDLQVIPV